MKNSHKYLMMMAFMMMPGFLLTTYAQKSVMLKYNLKNGDKFISTMAMNQEIDMDVQGQSMVINQDMDFEFGYSVSDVVADSFDLHTTINAIKMNQSVMGMEIKYDSKDTSTYNNAMVGTKISDQMNKLIGQEIISTTSVDGNVGTIDLGDLDKDNEVAGNMKSSFSQAVYPNHKVKIGESWENDITTSGIAEMSMHITYTLAKATRKQAFIEVKGTIDSPDATTKLKGTISGEMIVDRKTGWVTHSTFDQDFEMQMEQQGMSFPATISGTYEIDSQKVK
jgi:hypothetical protein